MDSEIVIGSIWVHPSPEGYLLTDLETRITVATRRTLASAMRLALSLAEADLC